MRRGLRLLAVAAVVLPVIALATDATAIAASEQGWWTTTNVSDTAGGVPPLPAADVPADGLLVEGGTGSTAGAADASPTAFAALVYDVPDGAVAAHLMLTVAPGSASVPDAALQLCQLTTTTFPPAQGGPMSAAPSYDCRRSVTASPAGATGAYDFSVAGLAAADALAVAVLPTSPTDRVVLSKPAADSLTTTPVAPVVPSSNAAPPTSAPAVTASPPPPPSAGAAAIAANPVAGGLTALEPVPAASAVPVTGPAPALAPSADAVPGPAPIGYAATPIVSLARPRTSRLLIVGGVAVLALLSWSAAGRLAVRRATESA